MESLKNWNNLKLQAQVSRRKGETSWSPYHFAHFITKGDWINFFQVFPSAVWVKRKNLPKTQLFVFSEVRISSDQGNAIWGNWKIEVEVLIDCHLDSASQLFALTFVRNSTTSSRWAEIYILLLIGHELPSSSGQIFFQLTHQSPRFGVKIKWEKSFEYFCRV